MINGVTWEAYTRMIAGPHDLNNMLYCKGVIGGMEMIVQNMEEQFQTIREYVHDEREKADKKKKNKESDDGDEAVSES